MNPTCPHCGSRASTETQLVTRHGLTYEQTITRCWRPGRPYSAVGCRCNRGTCPVTVEERPLPPARKKATA